LESSVALLQAASGLERLMVHNKNAGILKDSNVVQISAMLYYKASVISKLETNKNFIRKFHNMIFDSLKDEFGNYVDAKARTRPKSLHHVYEWDKAGNPAARLFRLKRIDSNTLSFKLDFFFLPSKTFSSNKTSKKKYKFPNKASIMESGTPVTISPRSSKRLVFEINNQVVFMPEGASVIVRNPGGKAAKNQFTLAYSHFFSGPLAGQAIRKSGFHRLFGSAMQKALVTPSNIKTVQYSFSPNSIRSQADAALSQAFGGGMI
jgi:hypothetical protein